MRNTLKARGPQFVFFVVFFRLEFLIPRNLLGAFTCQVPKIVKQTFGAAALKNTTRIFSLYWKKNLVESFTVEVFF